MLSPNSNRFFLFFPVLPFACGGFMVLNQPLGAAPSHSGPMVFLTSVGGTFKIDVSKMVWLACTVSKPRNFKSAWLTFGNMRIFSNMLDLKMNVEATGRCLIWNTKLKQVVRPYNGLATCRITRKRTYILHQWHPWPCLVWHLHQGDLGGKGKGVVAGWNFWGGVFSATSKLTACTVLML